MLRAFRTTPGKVTTSLVGLLLLGVASHALGIAQQSSGRSLGGSGAGKTGGSFGPGVETNFHRFTVPFALSRNLKFETAVIVHNGGTETIDVVVEWYDFFGSAMGTSAGNVFPGETLTFDSANSGESIYPVHSFYQRDSTADFEGYARVLVGPKSGSAKNVTVSALFVQHCNETYDLNATQITNLHVNRADDPDGDGIIDTRFKGD